MIPLRLRAEAPDRTDPFVVRLNGSHGNKDADTAQDLFLTGTESGMLRFSGPGGELAVFDADMAEIDGDVLLVDPKHSRANRLIRAQSRHNSLLVTERCDQVCVMCSQPPKRHHVDLFPLLRQAVVLAPDNAVIGITGGEPTLYKDQLLDLVTEALDQRPDLTFHILSNGQHLSEEDIVRLQPLPFEKVQWGIPIYSHIGARQDEIVGKAGAFDRLQETFALLAASGANIELRTVVMQPNVHDLPDLAAFIHAKIPFASVWAIMQLENIGYARMNWNAIFHDSGVEFGPIGRAVMFATARGHLVQLYNFPLCTVPGPYREFAVQSISDCKMKFLRSCNSCSLRAKCGGFFEWYTEKTGFASIAPQ